GDGTLAEHLSVTLTELALGFVAAVIVGLPTGFLLGTLPRLETALSPYLMAFYSTPRVAFFPLLITWFGFGLQSQVLLVFLSAFFPMCINAWAGVKTVEPVLVRA